jgi:hypothetical protein
MRQQPQQLQQAAAAAVLGRNSAKLEARLQQTTNVRHCMYAANTFADLQQSRHVWRMYFKA